MKTQIITFWQQRSLRERWLVLGWAIVISILIYCFAMVAPLLRRINQLEKKIPQLEVQVRNMRTTNRPKLTTASMQNTSNLREQVLQFLEHRQLRADVRSISASGVEVQLPQMPAAEAFLTLYSLREGTTTQISKLQVQSDGARDGVKIVAELGRT